MWVRLGASGCDGPQRQATILCRCNRDFLAVRAIGCNVKRLCAIAGAGARPAPDRVHGRNDLGGQVPDGCNGAISGRV